MLSESAPYRCKGYNIVNIYFNVQSQWRPRATALIKVADDALIKVIDGLRHHGVLSVLLAEADEFLADDPCKIKQVSVDSAKKS